VTQERSRLTSGSSAAIPIKTAIVAPASGDASQKLLDRCSPSSDPAVRAAWYGELSFAFQRRASECTQRDKELIMEGASVIERLLGSPAYCLEKERVLRFEMANNGGFYRVLTQGSNTLFRCGKCEAVVQFRSQGDTLNAFAPIRHVVDCVRDRKGSIQAPSSESGSKSRTQEPEVRQPTPVDPKVSGPTTAVDPLPPQRIAPAASVDHQPTRTLATTVPPGLAQAASTVAPAQLVDAPPPKRGSPNVLDFEPIRFSGTNGTTQGLDVSRRAEWYADRSVKRINARPDYQLADWKRALLVVAAHAFEKVLHGPANAAVRAAAVRWEEGASAGFYRLEYENGRPWFVCCKCASVVPFHFNGPHVHPKPVITHVRKCMDDGQPATAPQYYGRMMNGITQQVYAQHHMYGRQFPPQLPPPPHMPSLQHLPQPISLPKLQTPPKAAPEQMPYGR